MLGSLRHFFICVFYGEKLNKLKYWSMSSKAAGTTDFVAYKWSLALEIIDVPVDNVSGCVKTCGVYQLLCSLT